MTRHTDEGMKGRGNSVRTMLRLTVFALALHILPLCGSGGAFAQSIDQIAKSDPLIISGAVGTQNTFYHSSTGYNGRAELSNSLYANLNISFYGINMPFSFYLSNGGSSWNYPQFSFSVSPSWHDWTLHLGERSMAFSSYVYNSPFYGVGLEYGGNNIRFGAFYGRLKRAISDDPTDPAARSPQYSRYGWGFKVGYGTGKKLRRPLRVQGQGSPWQRRRILEEQHRASGEPGYRRQRTCQLPEAFLAHGQCCLVALHLRHTG